MNKYTKATEPLTVLTLEAGGPASMAAMQQLRDSNLSMQLIGADMDPNSPAQWLVDDFHAVLPASSPDYVQEIADLIDTYKVDMVLPSFQYGMKGMSELELPVFLNDFAAGLLCQDKWRFYKWCNEKGYGAPQTSLLGSDEVPEGKLYLKPRFGAGARDNFVAYDLEVPAIAEYLQARHKYIVQEFVVGEQWVVDAMRRDGQYAGSTIAQVKTHRAGHVTAAEIKDNEELDGLVRNVLEDLEYSGPANLDVMKNLNGEYVILELNPRFGGTIRFAHAAGANWPAYLLSGQDRFINNQTAGEYTIISSVVRLDSNRSDS